MISVVVLTYNSGRTIEACLASLVTQVPLPDEVLLVDDDSTDDTVATACAVADRTGLTLRVLRNGSHNISRGRNLGLDARHVLFGHLHRPGRWEVGEGTELINTGGWVEDASSVSPGTCVLVRDEGAPELKSVL